VPGQVASSPHLQKLNQMWNKFLKANLDVPASTSSCTRQNSACTICRVSANLATIAPLRTVALSSRVHRICSRLGYAKHMPPLEAARTMAAALLMVKRSCGRQTCSTRKRFVSGMRRAGVEMETNAVLHMAWMNCGAM